MYAVVSLLDEQHEDRLQDLWRDLESECGLAGITLTPLPHFSWHIAAEYDFKRLETLLAGRAAEAKPFTVHTLGLGLFTGRSPVIFIPVVKDESLYSFHLALWEEIRPLAVGPSLHYAPDTWVPHITLAYGDVDSARLGCAMERLAFRPYNWEIRIDHLALVYQLGGQVGRLQSKYMFGKIE